jgi:hypothetical protein
VADTLASCVGNVGRLEALRHCSGGSWVCRVALAVVTAAQDGCWGQLAATVWAKEWSLEGLTSASWYLQLWRYVQCCMNNAESTTVC